MKFILDDGTIISKFKMVNPNQRDPDDELWRKDRATFVAGKVVLSRKPKPEELGANMVLDVVLKLPKLTRANADALALIYSKQIAVLGNAKNNTLADVTKVSLSPSFAQKYSNELQKAVMANNASNEIDEMQRDDFSGIGGIW